MRVYLHFAVFHLGCGRVMRLYVGVSCTYGAAVFLRLYMGVSCTYGAAVFLRLYMGVSWTYGAAVFLQYCFKKLETTRYWWVVLCYGSVVLLFQYNNICSS